MLLCAGEHLHRDFFVSRLLQNLIFYNVFIYLQCLAPLFVLTVLSTNT